MSASQAGKAGEVKGKEHAGRLFLLAGQQLEPVLFAPWSTIASWLFSLNGSALPRACLEPAGLQSAAPASVVFARPCAALVS